MVDTQEEACHSLLQTTVQHLQCHDGLQALRSHPFLQIYTIDTEERQATHARAA